MHRLLIDGQLVDGDFTVDVIDPSTEQIAGRCGLASAEQLEQAIEAAATAFDGWSRTPIAVRREALSQISAIIESHIEELGRLLHRELGRPMPECVDEIGGALHFLRAFPTMDLPAQTIDAGEDRRVEVHRRPLGVVAAILPWNYPLLLLSWKLGPALLMGNTLVVKPAPTTPLSTLRIAELIEDVLPPGVLNVVATSDDLASVLVSHPTVSKVAFTGSTRTGARIMERAAPTLKRLTLELGGNDAALVLPDVDPVEIAPKLFEAAFNYSGQACIAIKRLYVHDAIYDAICDELAAIARSMRVGIDVGPLQNRRQYERVLGLLEDARSHGTIIAGGSAPDRPGYFVEPTIVRDIDEGTRIVDEEQFGPILPVLRFSDADEAMQRINASPMGLGGSVWSTDLEEARRLALQMHAGTVWINKHVDLDPMIPLGGAKRSGIGVELGLVGLEEYTQRVVISADN